MRAMHFSRGNRPADGPAPANSYIQEALAKQAASRPAKTPPKLMPVTPKLAKIKPGRKNRRTV